MSAHRMTLTDTDPGADRIAALVRAAKTVDGTPALNEAAMIAIGHGGSRKQVSAWDDDQLIGYALVLDDHVQLLVRPNHRSRGVATAILERLSPKPRQQHYWAFGDLAPARAWAESAGLHPVRKLLIMERSLAEEIETPVPPSGVRIEPYRSTDAEALIKVNTRAFSHHPEQGAMDAADLAARMAEPWYRNEDLLVAVRETPQNPRELIGFHWTKQHDPQLGEVYVLAVDPQAGGGGIGRALLGAGLHHLRQLGKERVILYVEDDQPRVVDLYLRAGFTVIHQDVVYASPDADSVRV